MIVEDEIMKKIHVSIVLYETDEFTIRRCIDSMFRYKKNLDVTLIDNSWQSSAYPFLKDFKSISYIHNPTNPGYGAGHNIAIKHSFSSNVDYHLVCNADIFFRDDVLGALLSYMNRNQTVGLVMPKVLNVDGSVQFLCKLIPTPIDLLIRALLPAKYRGEFLSKFEMRFFSYDKEFFVPYLSGCFMFFRLNALKEVGIFDERFFMYPEDIDITRRVAVSFMTMFYPKVEIFHEYGGASKKSFKMFLIHAFNIVKYFNKWGWFFDKERSRLNYMALNQNEK